MARRTSPAVRALVRELRRQGKSVRAIVAAVAQLGHIVTASTVGRIVGPKPKPRPRPPRRPPAAILADYARRLVAPGGDAAELLEAALVLARPAPCP